MKDKIYVLLVVFVIGFIVGVTVDLYNYYFIAENNLDDQLKSECRFLGGKMSYEYKNGANELYCEFNQPTVCELK